MPNPIKLIETGLENKNQGLEPVTENACRIASSRLFAKIKAITKGKTEKPIFRMKKPNSPKNKAT